MPGASITRRIGPADKHGEGAKRGVALDCQTLHLGHRVDWLTVAHKGTLTGEADELLTARLAEGHELQTDVAVELAEGITLRMSARSHDGWWYLENDDLRVVVARRAPGRWLVSVDASGVALARVGHVVAIERARVVAAAVLGRIEEERVRRVDLCADFVGFDLDGIDSRAWVRQRRCRLVDHRLDDHRDADDKRTGFSLGKSSVVLRVYDKTEELRAKRDDVKRDEEHARWRAAGWNGRDAVTRVEFQLRGTALKELGCRDPRRLVLGLDALWAYCTADWCRLVQLGTASRRKRCATDARWKVVRDVVFDSPSAAPRRRRARATVDARHVLGSVLNHTARAGVGGPVALGDESAREKVQEWTDEYAEARVRMLLHDKFAQAERAVADDVLRSAPPREVAARLFEKVNATYARASTLTLVDERLAIEGEVLARLPRKEKSR